MAGLPGPSKPKTRREPADSKKTKSSPDDRRQLVSSVSWDIYTMVIDGHGMDISGRNMMQAISQVRPELIADGTATKEFVEELLLMFSSECDKMDKGKLSKYCNLTIDREQSYLVFYSKKARAAKKKQEDSMALKPESSKETLLRLICAYQNYDWGKIGEESKVATLLKSSLPDFEIENIPYAEMWMGTHPTGPSVIETGQADIKSLATYIKDNPLCLGAKVIDKFGVKLPFLFKVLSVNKALSIQAHPTKSHAEQLHNNNPDMYKDPNHKPEMAIALTDFEALCGFRTPSEITGFFKALPELREIVGDENALALEASTEGEESKQAIKSCFYSLMTCSDDKVQMQLSALVKRHSKQAANDILSSLFLRIHSSFPDDVGCFGIYFFNYIKLQPGEAMFLGPNEPHAYLYGDCIECMACSDNVVRAGLTQKFKDVTTLCEMLTYDSGTAKSRLFEGKRLDKFTTLFAPPVPDFLIYKVKLPGNKRVHSLDALDSASIVLIVTGIGEVCSDSDTKASRFMPGSVFFMTAGDIVKMQFRTNVLLFRAAVNVGHH